ncbi:MAG: S8 family serine peptidase [Magnetococcales bacterium]|nr:S8 family serine peptidase [Magnetococcales bacterium]
MFWWRFFGISVLSLAVGGTTAWADSGKLDAGLSSRLSAHNLQSAQAGTHPLRAGEEKGALVAATVQFSGNGLAAMRALDVVVRSVLGNVATVLIPINRLAQVAALPEVSRLETPSRPVARLHKSAPFVKVDPLRTGSLAQGWGGNTGKDVLVGIIDSGIDINHGDFRDASGKTRIVRLWNQRSVTGATPPTGADGAALYGAECDTAAINAVLDTTPSGTGVCNPDDNNNHGTHVAGIAAGNGGGTGNEKAAGRFVGMAPEAGLLVANPLDKAVAVNGDPVLDAISWMTRVAKQLNKPLVINLSLGSYFGSRDGTGGFQKGIDQVSGAGVIVVAAAGNEGNAPIRAELSPMTQEQIVGVTFSIPEGRTEENLEFWSNGDNQYAVQLVCPNATTTDYITAGNTLVDFEAAGCGKISVTSSAPSSANGDRQYLITLGSGTQALASGNWTLNIRADAVPVANEKLGVICGETESGAVFTGTYKTAVTKEILTDSASARRAIAVAALNTNYVWNTASGETDKNADNGPLGDVGGFSSRGPRRVCSANAKYIDVSTLAGQQNADECKKPVMKPDLTAPGSYIMSSLSKAATAAATASDVEADGVHVAYMGTSMATPHVTGVVALMLQSNPQLTPEEAKRHFFTTLQSNGYTQAANLPVYTAGVELPANPNDAWGYGAMDAAASVRAVSGTANGVCGTAHNQAVATAPATGLCVTGTASVVSGSGPWSWSCAGVSGGSSATCSANLANATSNVGTLDVDKSSVTDASDGVLILRRLNRASSIETGVVLPAGQNNASVIATIDGAGLKLDVDKNGVVDATDGVLILRRLNGGSTIDTGVVLPSGQTNSTAIVNIDALK